MIVFWFYVILFPIAVWIGFRMWRGWRRAELSPMHTPGYVYFLSVVDVDEERPQPIKIGMTHRDPTMHRLPEIETMSPEALQVIYTIPSNVPALLEHTIHQELAPFRHHGEWFDRDATLAWLDNYKQGVPA